MQQQIQSNKDANNVGVYAAAIGVLGTGAAGGYVYKNLDEEQRKRIFVKDNFQTINKQDIKESFDKAKNITNMQDVNLLHDNRVKTSALQRKDGSLNVITTDSTFDMTKYLNKLRINDNEIFKTSKEIYGHAPTNKELLDFFMLHEFGHLDRLKDGKIDSETYKKQINKMRKDNNITNDTYKELQDSKNKFKFKDAKKISNKLESAYRTATEEKLADKFASTMIEALKKIKL